MAAREGNTMPADILIAYATRSGSTAEVAEAVGATLRDAGLMTDVLPMRLVESLKGRTAVILGAPLYIGRFPDEFHKFITRYHNELAPMRPSCFVLGPTRTEPKDFVAARDQATRQLDQYRWFHPAGLQIFGGRWDINSLPFPFSLARHIPMLPLNKIPGADIRDWATIRNWADGIARELKPAASLEERATPIR
jgi:menaquinone-dependent protoporphyrinogen oxidase